VIAVSGAEERRNMERQRTTKVAGQNVPGRLKLPSPHLLSWPFALEPRSDWPLCGKRSASAPTSQRG
jgi:hypothetical protein